MRQWSEVSRECLRWTLKFAKARPLTDGSRRLDVVILSFGYSSSIAICRATASSPGQGTDGARFDGRMLLDVVTNDYAASDV